MIKKAAFKHILGELPLTAEMYWQLRGRGKPLTKSFSLRRVEKNLPGWLAQAGAALERNKSTSYPKRRILVFSTLRYWIEHSTLMSVSLAGLGHDVNFTYLPYASNWYRPISRFDLRRQNAYAGSVLKNTRPLVTSVSLFDLNTNSSGELPPSLLESIKEVSQRDTQYTLQLEEIDHHGTHSPSARLYKLRLKRNKFAASAIMSWIQSLEPDKRPEVLITPNGSILEMGAVYQAASYLGIPIVTYEFGEQRGRIWLAQNSEVMLQDTDTLWQVSKDQDLNQDQWQQVRDLYASRQNASLWNNFSRLWQGTPSQGGDRARHGLGLDSRPIVLLAANVIGDSLTLGRQVFSENMTEWLVRTIQYFAIRTDVQLVVRIHPGERYVDGPSVAQVIQGSLPEIPPHIHLVKADAPVNTYDLVDIADLGLVYTTTTGMEMAMSGVPVIVAGKTHYRNKGFTIDPSSWEDYYQLLDDHLSKLINERLSREQVNRAWRYAFRFFFDFPLPFPWHLLDFWDELETWPIERTLSDEGLALFGETFRCLSGGPRHWQDAGTKHLSVESTI